MGLVHYLGFVCLSIKEEYYDEMTPDSGCFSVINSASFSNSNLNDLSLDLNAYYLKYIGTFADQQQDNPASQVAGTVAIANNAAQSTPANPFKLDRPELEKLNIYELNELIEQIELFTTELSDTLVQELALRDELEFEKETRNTFISLIMSIQVSPTGVSVSAGFLAVEKEKNFLVKFFLINPISIFFFLEIFLEQFRTKQKIWEIHGLDTDQILKRITAIQF